MPHGHDEEEKETFCKVLSFWTIGILTLVYCVGELGAAVYLGSLTLLSDGFHNLSDVASLYVAYWALKVAWFSFVVTRFALTHCFFSCKGLKEKQW